MNRLRTFICKHVIPAVEAFFFSAIDCVRDDLYEMGLRFSFADYFSTISLGDLFASRNHTDDDAWLTIIVAVGDCELGGGWAHPAQGVIDVVKAGDIFLVNPLQGHCTSCFGDALASRKMIAIFLSDSAFKASCISIEVANREGLQRWVPQVWRKRRR